MSFKISFIIDREKLGYCFTFGIKYSIETKHNHIRKNRRGSKEPSILRNDFSNFFYLFQFYIWYVFSSDQMVPQINLSVSCKEESYFNPTSLVSYKEHV